MNLKRVAAGRVEHKQEDAPVLVMKEAPASACDNTSVSPTEASAIDSQNINSGATKIATFELENKNTTKTALVNMGGRVGIGVNPVNYGLKKSATEYFASTDADAEDQWGTQVPKVQEFAALASMGGFLVKNITVTTTNDSQRAQTPKMIRTTPNGESSEKTQKITKIDNDLGWAVVENCMSALDSMNSIQYPVLPEAVCTVEIEYYATGITTNNYSEA